MTHVPLLSPLEALFLLAATAEFEDDPAAYIFGVSVDVSLACLDAFR